MRRQCALATALVAVSACGGVEESPIASAVDRTAAARSARVAFTKTLVHPDGKAASLGSGRGIIDFAGGRGSMTMRTPFVAALVQDEKAARFDVVFDDDTVCMRVPGATGEQRPWKARDVPSRRSAALGPDTPAGGLEFPREHGDVREAGRETVRGVGTTRYRVTINFVEAARDAPEEERARAERAFADGARRTLPVDVWLGRPRNRPPHAQRHDVPRRR